METNYEIEFTNGKEIETHIINYYDTNIYEEVEAYATQYARDEASGFLAEQGYIINKITKLV